MGESYFRCPECHYYSGYHAKECSKQDLVPKGACPECKRPGGIHWAQCSLDKERTENSSFCKKCLSYTCPCPREDFESVNKGAVKDASRSVVYKGSEVHSTGWCYACKSMKCRVLAGEESKSSKVSDPWREPWCSKCKTYNCFITSHHKYKKQDSKASETWKEDEDGMGFMDYVGGHVSNYVTKWKDCKHAACQPKPGQNDFVYKSKDGIWLAGAKGRLLYGDEGDLIVDMAGMYDGEVSFVKRGPKWADDLKKFDTPGAPAIRLNWPDRDIPPAGIQIGFWLTLWRLIRENVKAGVYSEPVVIFCCIGGHGRTGTAIACMMATDTRMGGEEIILKIRKEYCDSAVETKEQVAYVHRIVEQREKMFAAAKKAKKAKGKGAEAEGEAAAEPETPPAGDASPDTEQVQ